MYSKMPAAKRRFRPVKIVQEERKMLEESVPKASQTATKWALKIFKEWQIGRVDEDASLESCS